MRRRKVKGAAEKLLSYDRYVFCEKNFNRSIIDKFIKNKVEVCLELGMGRGKFIIENAIQNPDKLYIGVEIKEEVLLRAAENPKMENIDNLILVLGNVDSLEEYIENETINHIYINFCDPWPKKRWAKRRLTHKNYLKIYTKLLKENGEIHFKTDSEPLFEFSINEFLDYGLKVRDVYLDLHKNDFEIIKTEYEDKFVEKGLKIYSAIAVKL